MFYAGDLEDRKIMGSFMSQELFHDPDDFERVMCVNVKGVALGIKHATLVMIPRATDCIISTTSVAGVSEGMGPHTYTTSKHDIVGLTKNTAHELGRYGIPNKIFRHKTCRVTNYSRHKRNSLTTNLKKSFLMWKIRQSLPELVWF